MLCHIIRVKRYGITGICRHREISALFCYYLGRDAAIDAVVLTKS
jgi:hypothetical protein